jgi:hypothetical protein
MPVPDRVRDDGSGIQKPNTVEKYWIPDQVRNDKRATFAVLSIATQPRRRESIVKTLGFPFAWE